MKENRIQEKLQKLMLTEFHFKKLNVKFKFCSFWNLLMRAITPSYVNYDVELSYKPLRQDNKALK